MPVLRGYKDVLAVSWECDLLEGETISDSDTAVERAPAEDATILAAGDHTTFTDDTVTMRIDVPTDATLGQYHLRRTTTLSTGRQIVEHLVYLIEDVC